MYLCTSYVPVTVSNTNALSHKESVKSHTVGNFKQRSWYHIAILKKNQTCGTMFRGALQLHAILLLYENALFVSEMPFLKSFVSEASGFYHFCIIISCVVFVAVV